MIYVKSILVGVGAVVLLLVLLAAAAIVITMRGEIAGVGAVAVGVAGSSVLILGIVTFAVGFAWRFRRLSKRASTGE